MRLWHEKLIPLLPRQQLLGQHRECCALRGNGWGRKHATVDYVFRHSPAQLFAYHCLVMAEMAVRGYQCDCLWQNPRYRGKRCDPWPEELEKTADCYAEHDAAYLEECLKNLQEKGVFLDVLTEN